MAMTNQEMLALAATALGLDPRRLPDAWPDRFDDNLWDPLIDDGDCTRMEAQLGIDVGWYADWVISRHTMKGHPVSGAAHFTNHNGDKNKARRYASTMVAAMAAMIEGAM